MKHIACKGILLLMIFSFNNVSGQQWEWKVIDSITLKPIINAEIIDLKNSNSGLTTDSNGTFYINSNLDDTLNYLIRHINYEFKRINISPSKKTNISGIIKLTPIQYILNEIVIHDSSTYKSPYIREKITPQVLKESINKDIGEILKQLPNVSGIKKGGTSIDPVIRGFKYNQLLIITDDAVKIEGGCPNRMDPATSHIEAEDLSDIEVLKGPYSMRYGANFGSVIRLQTNPASFSNELEKNIYAKRGYESNWDGHTEYIRTSIKNKSIYLSISGHRKDYENYQSGSGDLYKTAFKKFGYNGKFGIKLNHHHLITGNLTISKGRNVYYPSLAMDEKSDDSYYYSFTHKYIRYNSKLSGINLNYYHSKVKHLMHNHYRPFSDTVMSNTLVNASNQGYKAELEIKQDENKRFIFGHDLEWIEKDGEREKIKIRELTLPAFYDNIWREANIQNYGFFNETQIKAFHFDWILGIRFDYNQAKSNDTLFIENRITNQTIFENKKSNFSTLSYSLSGKTELTNQINMQIAVGKGVRNAGMVERYIKLLPTGYDNYDYLGNPNLKPEKNYQADLNLSVQCLKNFEFSVNLFYSMIKDYIKSEYLSPSVVKATTPGTLGVKQFTNANDWVIFKGGELRISNIEKKRFNQTISAGLTKAIDLKAYNIETKLYQKDFLAEIPPFEITGVLDYSLWENKVLTEIKARYVARKKDISVVYNENISKEFYTLDLRIRYKVLPQLDCNLGIKNLLNQNYYEHLNRNILGSSHNLHEAGRVVFINAVLSISSK